MDWNPSLQTATRARHVAVARALDAEALSASEVATICQISRSRVYQSRDTGRALLAER